MDIKAEKASIIKQFMQIDDINLIIAKCAGNIRHWHPVFNKLRGGAGFVSKSNSILVIIP